MQKQISAKCKIVIIPVLHSVSIVPVYMSYITDHVWIQYKMYMYMQKYSISYYFIKWKVQTTLTLYTCTQYINTYGAVCGFFNTLRLINKS